MSLITIPVNSGGKVTFDPATNRWDFSQLTIHDIAWGLAGLNRYGSQTPRDYNVAEHSYHVALRLTGWKQIVGLFHDATECLGFGDMNGPLKRLSAFDGYRFAEVEAQHQLYQQKLGDYLPPLWTQESLVDVHVADQEQGRLERQHVWSVRKESNDPLNYWSRKRAAKEFYYLFNNLVGATR